METRMTARSSPRSATAPPCAFSAEDRAGALRMRAQWDNNDASLMLVLCASHRMHRLEDLLPDAPIEMAGTTRCRDDNHDLAWHTYVREIQALASIANDARAVATLQVMAALLEIPRVELTHLAPFTGAGITTVEHLPEHIARALLAFEIEPATYFTWRRHGATPRRTGVSADVRIRDAACAVLLRTLHDTASGIMGIGRDPELGPRPAAPTERALLDGADLSKVRAYLESGVSGHAFHNRPFLDQIGLGPHVTPVVFREHCSNAVNPMCTIVDPAGNVIESLTAVCELELLWVLAFELNADVREAASKYGRGARARCLATAILERLSREGRNA